VFFAGRVPNLASRVEVHRGDCETHEHVGPDGGRQGGDEACGNDAEVGEDVIASGEEGCARNAARMMANPCEREGTAGLASGWLWRRRESYDNRAFGPGTLSGIWPEEGG
jgi:hypothetical protein